MKNVLFLTCLSLISIASIAQNTFMKTFGGANDEVAQFGILTTNGDYIVVGYTNSFGSGGQDAYILKIDTFGNELWSKTIGGSADERLISIRELSNGDFIGVGDKKSGSDRDIFVVRFDGAGNIAWTKTYGGTNEEMGKFVMETSDGFILISGFIKSFGAGNWDMYLLKMDTNGNAIWTKTYGQNGNDWVPRKGIIENSVGNYVLGGTWTQGIGFSGHNAGILEIDTAGNLLSSTLYGAAQNEGFRSLLKENNVTYALGDSWSWNGSNCEIWMSELDSLGNINWSKTYGIPNQNIVFTDIAKTASNDFFITGYDFSINNGVLLKIDAQGTLLWSKSFNGAGDNSIQSIQTVNNGVIAVGSTDGYGQGGKDIWIIKTDANGNASSCGTNTITMTTTTVTPSITNTSPSSSSASLGQIENLTTTTPAFQEAIQCAATLPPVAIFSMTDSVLCENYCIDFMDSSLNNPTSWSWTFIGANTATTVNQHPMNICFPTSGTYTATLIVSNASGADTLTKTIIVHPFPSVNLGNDTTICNGQSLTLDATLPNATYLWFDNSTNSTVTVNTTGAYWVEVTVNGCTSRNAINVTVIEPPTVDLGNDTTICAGGGLLLDASHPDAANYVWQDGSINSMLIVNQAGIYSVTVSNACGFATDSITIQTINITPIDLGNDTIICLGTTLTLDGTHPDATNYLWQDGSMNPTYNVTQAGTYIVGATLSCGFISDTIVIQTIDIPIVDLGNDTTLCGATHTLNAFHPHASSYFWQDGSIDPIYSVNQSGIYSVMVANTCGSTTDTINLQFINTNLHLNLGNDTALCSGQTLNLDVFQSDIINYLWQDSSMTSTYTINQSGLYTVQISNLCETISDSINVTIFDFSLNLGNDTVAICKGELHTLDAFHPNATNYLWQDGSMDAVYTVTQTGIYHVQIANVCDTLSDTMTVIVSSPVFSINLGKNQEICVGDSIFLDATTEGGIWYLWQDSTSTPQYIATQSGEYQVTIMNGCGQITDDISLTNENCCNLYVPNAFTPNLDGKNDLFQTYVPDNCLISSFSIKIFDRWGSLVFFSTDINEKWDGTFRGEKIESGVYIWFLNYNDGTREHSSSGDVTMIR